MSGFASVGLPQCFLAMKSFFDANPNKQVVYGFATNASNWILCTYKGDTKFEISKRIPVMKHINEESVWMAGPGADLAKRLHTILDAEIKYVLNKRQTEAGVGELMDTRPQVEPVESKQMEAQQKEEAAVEQWIKDSAGERIEAKV